MFLLYTVNQLYVHLCCCCCLVTKWCLTLLQPCRRLQWQSTPVFLPAESRGQKNLGSYGPWGHKESDTAKATWHGHCNLPGSSVHGISQARMLEWVAISFFGGIVPIQRWNPGCLLGRKILYHWAAWGVHMYTFIPLFVFPSHLGHHRALGRVPYAI